MATTQPSMRVLTGLDDEAIRALLADEEFFWCDLSAPTPGEVIRLGHLLGLHPLAVEDTQEFGQRPKLDEYGDYALLVMLGARGGDNEAELATFEVHAFVSGRWIVTVHRDPVPELDALVPVIQGPCESEEWIVYRVIDTVTDTLAACAERLIEGADRYEELALDPNAPDLARRIIDAARPAKILRRRLEPERILFGGRLDQISALPGLEAGTRMYLRDVGDTVAHACDLLDEAVARMHADLELHLAVTNTRLSRSNERLSVVATIFLPLTVLTGFFGQNFGWLTDHITSSAAFWGLGFGLFAAITIVTLALLRRRHLI